jgi:hypothetical protein
MQDIERALHVYAHDHDLHFNGASTGSESPSRITTAQALMSSQVAVEVTGLRPHGLHAHWKLTIRRLTGYGLRSSLLGLPT